MPTISYELTYAAQSWRDALLALLPNYAYADDWQMLERLPIFAVVVVVDNAVLATHDVSPDTLMQHWVDSEPYWQLKAVKTQDETVAITATKGSATISDVSVFRYVLVPSKPEHITPEKKDAAAHIIDEQITSYLRRKLAPSVPKEHYVDCHILSITQMLRRHKLACFDMDSTLIKQEVITELAKIAGIGDKVDAITESAMRGEIDFTTSFTERVALLEGLEVSVVDEIIPMLIPNMGAFVVISALKKLGYHTALISGGFEPFAKHIATLLGIDEYHANVLDVSDNRLTGNVVAPIIDGKQKAKIVSKIAEHRGIDLADVICIGDGANDLPMMAISDVGIAFHAKPIVQAKADASINVTGLEGVLYALGYPALNIVDNA